MSYTSTDLLEIFRDEVQDKVEPFLWSSSSFFSYLDDAQKMFCRLTEGIEDSRTPEVTQLAVVPDIEWYPISPLILKIRLAYRLDTGARLGITFPERLEQMGVRFDGRSGPVDTIVQGFEKHALRMWPMPNETVTVQLSVFRLPLLPIDDDDDVLEVDDQHQLSLLLWCKYRAYDKQDQDGYDKRKSLDYKARFEEYCVMAKREQVRARHIPGNVAYGGIPLAGAGNFPNRNDYYNR